MIRLIGILTGFALGIAILILAFGIPDLAPPQPAGESTGARVAEPGEPPGEVPPAVLEVEEQTPPAAAEPVSPLAEERVAPPPTAQAEEPANPAPTPAAAAVAEPDAVPVEDLPPAVPPAVNWYAFWSPFRSRIAADGFVAELQRTTGLDYRVVKLKPGIYEVAFAYTDDADIEDKLNRISAATGMDMTGG